MSDLRLENMDFEKMDFKELRSAVKQCFKENILLRDELAIMKRKYEDLLYNLDYENFSSSVISDGKNMQTSIKQTAESVKIAAEKADEAKAKTAELEVTAERISSTVTKVEKNVSNLSSEISQTADNIRMVVAATYSNPVEVDKFVRTGADKEVIYYEKETDLYWYYNGAEWVETTNANFGTVFEQTATGFKLKGNVTVDGSLVVNLAKVANDLYLGEYGEDVEKHIYFNESANIYNYQSWIGTYTGLGINASSMRMDLTPDNIYIKKNSSSYVNLEDYVSENCGGGGTVTAVFA